MKYPYIYTSEREFVQREEGFDNETGVTYRRVEGEHAIWAARVPFLPAMLSSDFTRLGRDRIPLIQRRQFRFLYDLARARDHSATFALRFIGTPNPVLGEPNLIDIVFLGKVFSVRPRGGQQLAERLWEKFVSNFPLEDPFNYPLEPVADPADFAHCHEPIALSQVEPRNILEIRKYEDMPIRNPAALGRVERKGDYIAHPFVPTVDFGPMARFFVALAAQPCTCYASVSLRPTRMFDQEVYNVSFAIGQFKHTAREDDDVTEEYIRTRANVGTYIYQELMQEREQLVAVRVQVVGEQGTPYGLSEALGSEMMGNLNNKYPTQWTLAQPADDTEMAAALHNLRYLEQDNWGDTIAAPPLRRLRYLATAQEAYGAFRLPIPPESGYMPGVLIRSEPFVAPADAIELRRKSMTAAIRSTDQEFGDSQPKKVDLGVVFHRGNATAQHFHVNVTDLTRHALIAGSTGGGKSNTIMYLLSQLWGRHRIPFLVLYPVDKADYRHLLGFSALADDLLVFTLGDEGTSPFRFNPFEVPEGILLKTHLSRLMRVFAAAFTLVDPLPMVYRDALRRVYRDYGWDVALDRGASGRDYPIMSDFYDAIKQVTDHLNYGREVQDNVRQASVIRVGDLLENAGYVVNVRRSLSLAMILNQPTVMELGRVGSPQDTSLLMGFLLMRFVEEVERNPRPADLPHVTVIEEAHRLMADVASSAAVTGDSRGSAGEDFSNILAEVRGHGESIIVAEQTPTLLVKGAIGNTYLKVGHWLEDPASFELFSKVMNLSAEQQEYARTLTPGFAIVRSPTGKPVHIKVPRFDEDVAFDESRCKDLSDGRIKLHMAGQRQKIGIEELGVVRWQAPLSSSYTGKGETDGAAVGNHLAILATAPMRTCAFCRPLRATSRCRCGVAIRNRLLGNDQKREEARAELAAALADGQDEGRWHRVTEFCARVQTVLSRQDAEERKDIAYCYLAHAADTLIGDYWKPLNNCTPEQRLRIREMLARFASRYSFPTSTASAWRGSKHTLTEEGDAGGPGLVTRRD